MCSRFSAISPLDADFELAVTCMSSCCFPAPFQYFLLFLNQLCDGHLPIRIGHHCRDPRQQINRLMAALL